MKIELDIDIPKGFRLKYDKMMPLEKGNWFWDWNQNKLVKTEIDYPGGYLIFEKILTREDIPVGKCFCEHGNNEVLMKTNCSTGFYVTGKYIGCMHHVQCDTPVIPMRVNYDCRDETP